MSTINERIARVKRWHYHGEGYASPVKSTGPLRDWSGSIADAWELVEEMTSEPSYVCIESPLVGENKWRCSVDEPNAIYKDAPTAPEAICLAWLAVMEER